MRGFRIELGEVESALSGHPGVREAAVVVREDGDRGPRLVGYVAPVGAVEGEPEALLASLRAWLGRMLPEYMVPTAWVVLPALPLTPNGKVDRKALPVPGGEDKTAGYAAPRTPNEEQLAAIWREVLGVERVGVHDDFFELGGHSLLAHRVLSRLAEETGTELPLAALFQAPTVARLAQKLSEAPDVPVEAPAPPVPVWVPKRSDYVAPRTLVEEWLAEVWAEVLGVERVGVHDDFFELGGHSLLAHRVLAHITEELGDELPISTLFQAPTVEKLAERLASSSPAEPGVARHEAHPQDGYPLSSSQLRLWLVDRFEPWTAVYNLWVAVRFEGELDTAVLVRALAAIQGRHEPLRTVFGEGVGEPVQVVLPPVAVPVPRLDLADLAPAVRERALTEALQAEALQPFDLRRGPVVRYLLARLGDREHVLLTTFHHIAVDGWSLQVFFRELVALYGAFAAGRPSSLPDLPMRYVDHALRQRRALESETVRHQIAWWQRQLAGVPVLELPVDRQRPPARSYLGATRRFDLGPKRTEALRAFGRAEGGTLFMVLLAGFVALLSRYSGQDDFTVGTPVAGRNRLDLEGLIGLFINTLVLRAGTEDDPPFRELLGRLRDTVLAAQGHQDVPFERLVEELHPDRASGHTPLFQVLFAFMSQMAGPLAIPGLEASLIEVEAPVSKFDLSLAFQEYPDRLSGWLEYRADLFEAATIEHMEGHLLTLLAGAVEAPGRGLGELPLLSPAERRQLAAWNATGAAPSLDLLVHTRFEERAALAPGLPAVAEETGEAISYGDLNRQANRLARHLRGLGVGPGVPVAGCLERSLDMVVTLLAVLKAGGVWLPLDPAYPSERLELLLTDGGAAVMVARRDVAAGAGLAGLGTAWPVWLDEDAAAIAAQDGADLAPSASPLDVAYVIYTSGSTGRPKGVAVPHGEAAAHFDVITRLYDIRERDRVLQFSSLSFDVSLEQILTALGAGATLVLRGIELWGTTDLLARMAELQLTHVNLPTAYWQRWVHDLAPWVEPPAALRLVVAGGEEMLAEAARLWRRSPLAGVRLLNGYGPTETIVTPTLHEIGRAEEEGAGLSVPIGLPTPGRTAHVLDRHGQLVPAGVPGELCLGGLLARGYHERPELTAARFVPDPFGAPGERLYRTGDLVRRRSGGALEFLGRLDNQVKVRGFRIELGEIESALLAHPAVREAVVLALADDLGDTADCRLAAYVVNAPEPALTAAELSAFLAARLPSYMVPPSFTLLAALPLTPNGKVDRQALPRPVFGRPAGESPTPRGASQELLAGIWMELLGVEQVEPRDSFFELGGHSLLATQLVSRIRAVFGVDLPFSALFESPALAELAARIDAALRGPEAAAPAPPIVPGAHGSDNAPLSFAQQRLWFLDRLEPDSSAYTVPGAARLRGPLRLAALAAALTGIVRRHESQRTVFTAHGEDPVQVVLPPPAEHPLPVVDLAALPDPEPEAMRLLRVVSRRPFDLGAGPLLRTLLLRLAPGDHLLGVLSHHIVSDAWSLGVMLREAAALYRAAVAAEPPALPELPVQYADFAVWQRQWLAGDVLGHELAHWRSRLAGAPQTLELPADRPRPAVPSGRAGYRTLALPAGFVADLKALSLREGWTPFMALLAAFYALLARYTGQRDIVVGTPVANRNRLETEALIGFFTNTLALRLDLSGDPAFRELGRRARAAVLDGQAHQDLPFERLVEDLAPERMLGRTPLFQVMFVLRPEQPALDLPDVEAELLDLETGTAKFDLTLSLGLDGQGLDGVLEFSRDLFDDATAGRLLGHFRTLLEAAVAAPETRLSELPLLTPAERLALAEWSRPPLGYPEPFCVHHPVVAQAARTPEAEAVVSGGERLTYRQLLNRARRLARRLAAMGVGPDVPVGIFLDRSPAMMVAVLGVLEAGGAYLALESTYPRERLLAMLEDARPPVVITRRGLMGEAPESDACLLAIDEADLDGVDEVIEPPLLSGVLPDHIVYLVYTSGTTGRPKGIAMTHAAISVMLVWQLRTSSYGAGRTLQFSPLSFDVSFQEAFSAWWAGGTVVLISEEVRRDPPAMVRWMAEHRVDRLFLPFVALQQVAVAALEMPETEAPLTLREVMSGGEQLFVTPQVAGLFEKLPGAALFNHFGPSEAHAVSWLALTGDPRQWPERPTVGHPIDHGRLFLLDAGLQPVPAGVPGELWVGGAGLARGYLGRPDLTAERFMPDPFQDVEGWQPGARLYRTGDLGRLLPDGELEFLGRGDSQVKIRGYRIELAEVETAIARHPAVVQTAVAVRGETSVTRRLAAYVVFRPGEPEPTPAELKSFLSQTLPDPMVPAVWVRLDALPLTATGKVNRRALPAPEDFSEEGLYVPPQGPAEEMLASLWGDVLGLEQVGAHDNFFDLGGHSLLATQVMSRLREAFGVELPLRRLFEGPTVAELAREVEVALAAEHDAASAIPRAPRDQPLPLSFSQERLWFLDRLQSGGTVYSLPMALRLDGRLEVPALEAVFAAIVRRHETLRTVFAERDGEPVQVVLPAAGWQLPVADLRGLPHLAREREARRLTAAEGARPFDLARGPLLRTTLLCLAWQEYLLLINMHHIVSDGWSMGVLVREMSVLYEALGSGRPRLETVLPELPVQYADFALWQRRWLTGEVLERQHAYWRDRLAGVSSLDLPTDRPRPAMRTFRGAEYRFALDGRRTEALRVLARREAATPFMALAAAAFTLLTRYSGQRDLSLGTAIANRNRIETEGLIGFFVNTLVLRADVGRAPDFASLLRQVREVTLGAYAHQDLPFEELVAELHPNRDLSRTPLFQVMLALQNAPLPASRIADLTLSPEMLEVGAAKFDLSFALIEQGDGMAGALEYSTDLFDRSTAARLCRHLIALLDAAVAAPSARLPELEMLSAAERQQVIEEWNDTAAVPGPERLLHQLFEEQADLDPGALAAVWEGRSLTYGELEARANRLAWTLRRLGAGPAAPVAVWMDRSLDMLAAVLGIAKAGAAYLPLDAGWPAERVETVLANTAAGILATRTSHLSSVQELWWRLPRLSDVVCLDVEEPQPAPEPLDLEEVGALWDAISERSTDWVTAGGFVSSYTGQPFPESEVLEYRDRVLQLAAPWTGPDKRVLEIGCGSGLILWELAPRCARYVGIDPSERTQERNRERAAREGLTQLELPTGFAHEIDAWPPGSFDLVLLASTAQFFPGPRYLERVIELALSRLAPGGAVLIADVMDARRQAEFRQSLAEYAAEHPGSAAAVKLAARQGEGRELAVDEELFHDLDLPELASAAVHHRREGFPNELRFRYDVVLRKGDAERRERRKRLWTSWHVEREATARPVPVASPVDLAYVIHTSGSTGVPKGIAVQHRSAVDLIRWINTEFGVGPGDRLLFVTSLAFDLSVWDIFGGLGAGATVHVASEAALRDPERLARLLRDEPITVWDSAPAALQQLVPLFPDPELGKKHPLRLVMLSGDWIPVPLPDAVRAAWPGARVMSLGGATETTIWSNWYPVGEVDPRWPSIPYGRPITGARYHVLDRAWMPCPIGVPGDLYIGGTVLSTGYARLPGMTAEKFVPDLWSAAPGGRLYATGDRARCGRDGNLEFLGRVDQQVKVRGYRIELEEIEAALSRHPGVREAVVLAREDVPGDKRLVGYVVPAGQPAPSPAELRAALQQTLPDYMVPWTFVLLDVLPLTSSGKVDRAGLPAPQALAAAGEEYVAPRTDVEKAIAAAWRDVLQVPRVGVHDNFFELGGSSLLIAKLHGRLKQALGRDLSMMDLFRHPTIDALTRHLAQDEPRRESGAEQARERTKSRQESLRQLSEARSQRRSQKK
ncbi:MAG TPA: amino acid adenylation domain-containing protein [Thermoanaerobaculia bacterium]|nr:amino acid adenylation domain-containing protein [Thermoanaerobaculia bacterium]